MVVLSPNLFLLHQKRKIQQLNYFLLNVLKNVENPYRDSARFYMNYDEFKDCYKGPLKTEVRNYSYN